MQIFPYTLGGFFGDTMFVTIDVDSNSNVVAGGYSNDNVDIVTSDIPPDPIAIYIDYSGNIVWAKIYDPNASTVSAVQFTPDGSSIILMLGALPIVIYVLNPADGLSLYKYTFNTNDIV
jgi:hypothetical protein